jgi:hypothetical protein
MDESVVCETGGGFTKTEWSVAVNDGWLTVAQLVRRGRVGDVGTELQDEDDPHGAAGGGHWVNRPAQVWYRRRTYVLAPIGTRFRKRVWTPVRDPARDSAFSRSDSEFELRGEGRLVSLQILADRAARRARGGGRPEAPLAKGETLRHLDALLARLGSQPSPTPEDPRPPPTPQGPAPTAAARDAAAMRRAEAAAARMMAEDRAETPMAEDAAETLMAEDTAETPTGEDTAETPMGEDAAATPTAEDATAAPTGEEPVVAAGGRRRRAVELTQPLAAAAAAAAKKPPRSA